MYHWQTKHWPTFEFDEALVRSSIDTYSKKAYSIEGALSQLSSSDHDAAFVHLLVEEALSTSAIEGEKLNREEVRSSVAKFLGLQEPERGGYFPKEQGIAAMLIDVRNNIQSPMSKELLCQWHNLLLHGCEDYYLHPIIKGNYRNSPIDVIREDLYGDTEIVYIAPGTNRNEVELEMDSLIQWYNTTTFKGQLKQQLLIYGLSPFILFKMVMVVLVEHLLSMRFFKILQDRHYLVCLPRLI